MVTKLEANEVVAVGEFEVYTNGSGELFVRIKSSSKVYRMKDTGGQLHIVGKSVDFQQYGGSSGLIVKA